MYLLYTLIYKQKHDLRVAKECHNIDGTIQARADQKNYHMSKYGPKYGLYTLVYMSIYKNIEGEIGPKALKSLFCPASLVSEKWP